MNKIASFTVNHLNLLPGVYVSRRDYIGSEVVTTFDLRFTRPNLEPPMDNPGIHSIEHLVATFLRNHPVWSDKTIYFGPMGCRTGFYLLTRGLAHEAAIKLVRDAYKFISEYDDRIPGCSEEECGNYKEHNLADARKDVLPLLNALENYTVEMLDYSWHMK